MLQVISAEQREMIARVCNAITLLTDHSLQISETSIMRVVTEAMQREVRAHALRTYSPVHSLPTSSIRKRVSKSHVLLSTR
jgi:hypothetical protein